MKKQHKQQGIVLVVSLVFLIALTAVAAALMQNTTTDMKMSGASENKMVAVQEAVSAIDEVIFNQVNPLAATNIFAQPLSQFYVLSTGVEKPSNVLPALTTTNHNGDINLATISAINHMYKLENACPRSKFASSTNVFTCNILQIKIQRKYGRTKTNSIEVNARIAQELLSP